ncbi:hypothetical protein ACI2IY_21770 [Lysobacter enzymogenes]|uniref:hypothetical protein n=1 Tax=Lysobacter enzymogenes TaxID=69 RepID=UPI00384E8A71
MTPHYFAGQRLAGTRLDSQGEKLSLEDLRNYVDFCKDRRVPLHQQHQIGEPTMGFIENIRLVQDDQSDEEWVVIGDVTVESGAFEKGFGGFSISFMAPLVDRASATCLLYVPYPHYNNKELIEELAENPNLKIGKWIKKSAESANHALFGATIAFALTPVWDHLYKSKIAPVIENFLGDHLKFLAAKNIFLEHIQIVLHNGHEVELRFIPERGKEQWCFSQQSVMAGISLVAQKIHNNPLAEEHGVQRVVLRYSTSARAYELSRIEYRNGYVDAGT